MLEQGRLSESLFLAGGPGERHLFLSGCRQNSVLKLSDRDSLFLETVSWV